LDSEESDLRGRTGCVKQAEVSSMNFVTKPEMLHLHKLGDGQPAC